MIRTVAFNSFLFIRRNRIFCMDISKYSFIYADDVRMRKEANGLWYILNYTNGSIFDMYGNEIESGDKRRNLSDRDVQSYLKWLTDAGFDIEYYKEETEDDGDEVFEYLLQTVGTTITLKAKPTREQFDHIVKLTIKERGGGQITLNRVSRDAFKFRGRDSKYDTMSADDVLNELNDIGRYGMTVIAVFDTVESAALYVLDNELRYDKYFR